MYPGSLTCRCLSISGAGGARAGAHVSSEIIYTDGAVFEQANKKLFNFIKIQLRNVNTYIAYRTLSLVRVCYLHAAINIYIHTIRRIQCEYILTYIHNAYICLVVNIM